VPASDDFLRELTRGQVAASDGAAVETDDYGNSLPNIDARLNGAGYASLGLRGIHVTAENRHRDPAVGQEAVLLPIWSSGAEGKVGAGCGDNR
jgi:hypothetical protein